MKGGFNPSNTIIRSCLLPHLKETEINSFEDESKELVEYFLKNASGLEKLKI